MLQESIAVDFGKLIREPSTAFKIYMLFLAVACIVTCRTLIRVWRVGLSFRGSTKANSAEHTRLLRSSSTSLTQWIVSVLLSYGILFSISLYDVSEAALNHDRMGGAALLFAVQDYALGLTMALLVVSFVFLARWYLLKRIEQVAENCQPQ